MGKLPCTGTVQELAGEDACATACQCFRAHVSVAPLKPHLNVLPCLSKTVCVTTVQEIEQAIAKLPRQEFFDLARWFDEERNRKWDEQIETDSKSGALDSLLREVEDDIEKGRTRPNG
jgi:hypothetical protein